MTYWQTLMLRAGMILTLGGALWALTACSGSTASGADLAPPPPSLVQPCEAALALPVRDLMQAEVERFWRADRARLADCRDKHQGMVDWADGVREALGQ